VFHVVLNASSFVGDPVIKEIKFLPQTLISNPFIFTTLFRRPLIFQTTNTVRSGSESLKYQRFTKLGV